MLSVGSFEYSQSDLIGHGAFALVFRGRAKKSGGPVAIKQISLKSVPDKLSSARQKEIAILKELKHPNIVQLHHYHETKSDLFLVMEYCNGGDLGDYLQLKKTLSEDSIRHLSLHIAGALEVLQRVHVIHRDIKPQNLLLHSALPASTSSRPFRDYTIKLADFGFARHLTGADLAATLCGSPLYMAPEVLMGQRYDSRADLWSVGTILYQCLMGAAPFTAPNPHALRRKYEKGQLVPRIPEGTSSVLADLLTKLLQKSPSARLSHEELFAHKFLTARPETGLQHTSSLPAKSSPVPIRRLSSVQPPRRSLEASSPSSAPPTLHPIGSYPELFAHNSPISDVVDHGFILVDYPGSASPGKHSSASPSSLPLAPPLSTPFYSRQHTSPSNFQPSRRRSHDSSSPPVVPFAQLMGAGLATSPSPSLRPSPLQTLASHGGSAAKLSSLAEERVGEGDNDLITPSQLLNSDEDEFAARFSLHSSSVDDFAPVHTEEHRAQPASSAEQDSSLMLRNDSLELVRCVLQMARNRQAPLALLSSSSLSGGVDHTQRCQDQLLLYGKAASLLLLQEPLSASAEELLLSCVAEAEAVRCQLQPELLQQQPGEGTCAEELLLAEALSLCKTAALEEQGRWCSGKSVVKAKLLLGHLLSLACTPTDTATLQQYINFLDGPSTK